MRALVIGGTQFIGHGIVGRLVTRGHDVTVLHRKSQHDLGPSVDNIQMDRSDHDGVRTAIRHGRFEVVFDLAYDWERGTTVEDIAAAARACGDTLHRYVYMSSVAAYGQGLDHRESDPLAPADHANAYAAHKASAERMLFGMHETTGFPVATFRPPFVHGPRQPFYREQFFWDRLRDRRPIVMPGDGATPMQWVFVSDVAEACVRAMEVPEASGQAFNMAHAPTTHRGFLEAVARAAGVEAALVAVPRARIQAAGGQAAGPQLYFGQYLDLSPITEVVEKAPRMLGVVPTPMATALLAGFAWYAAQPRRPVDYSFEDRLLATV
jgi:nucleoside-diphosphate-sugar epimerase